MNNLKVLRLFILGLLSSYRNVSETLKKPVLNRDSQPKNQHNWTIRIFRIETSYREHSLSRPESAWIFWIFITDVIFEILKFKVYSIYMAPYEACRLKYFLLGFLNCIDNLSKNCNIPWTFKIFCTKFETMLRHSILRKW